MGGGGGGGGGGGKRGSAVGRGDEDLTFNGDSGGGP